MTLTEKINRLVKHYPGQHDQKSHGNWARVGVGQLDRERFEALVEALDVPKYGTREGEVSYGEHEGKPRLFDRVREKPHYPVTRANPRPPKYLYRAISDVDWKRIQEQGYMDTWGEMNLDESEGLNAAFQPSTFYLPKVGAGRIVRIDYSDEDKWTMNERIDSYAKTHNRIPLERISAVTPIIEGRLEPRTNEITGTTRLAQSHYVLDPGAEATTDEFLLTWGDIRRVHGNDWNAIIEKHYGPGPHPGTSTPQSVHGGGGISVKDVSGLFGVPGDTIRERVHNFIESGGEWTGPSGWRYYVNSDDTIWVESPDGVSKWLLISENTYGGVYSRAVHGHTEGHGRGFVGVEPWEELAAQLESELPGLPPVPRIGGEPASQVEFLPPSANQVRRATNRIEHLQQQLERTQERITSLESVAPHARDDKWADTYRDLRSQEVALGSEKWNLERYIETPMLLEGMYAPPIPSAESKEVTSFSGKTGTIMDPSPVTEARGINTDPADIFEAELISDAGYFRSVVDTVETGGGYSTDYVIVRGRILNDDGYDIGTFERLLYDDGHVNNSSFFLNPSSQGKGIGSIFWSHWEQELANAGFDYMTVSTADIGRYAWVMAGYSGGDIGSWVEDLRENYVYSDSDDVSSWLDDKWTEAFDGIAGDDYDIRVSDGMIEVWKDGFSQFEEMAWRGYVEQDPYGGPYGGPSTSSLMELAEDPIAMREYALDTLNNLYDYDAFEDKELDINPVEWGGFYPEDFSLISDPDLRAEASQIIADYDRGWYPDEAEFAQLGAGTSHHIGKEIILNGPGWDGEKDISWLRETELAKRLVDVEYQKLWRKWVRKDPAAVENDSPEWVAAVKEHFDRKRKVRNIVKHSGPGDHPSGSSQKVHGMRGVDRLPGVNWSQYGVRHPSIPDRALYSDWSPVMSSEEADEFLASHGLNTIVYGAHATTDPGGVMSEGFLAEEVSEFNGWGDGLYMVHEDAYDYYESSGNYAEQGVSLRVAMGFENLLVVHSEDASYKTFRAVRSMHGVGSEFHWDGVGIAPLDHYKIITEWAKIPWDSSWDGERLSNGSISPSDNYPGLAKVLLAHGYDGLQINAPPTFPIEWLYSEEVEFDDPNVNYIRFAEDLEPAPGTAGSQTVVFDPQHAVIIGKTEHTRLESGEAHLAERLEEVSKQAPKISDEEVWRVFGPFLTYRVEKHGKGSHDEKSHGNWAGGQRSDQLDDGSARRAGVRVTKPWSPISARLGDCYMNAGSVLLDEDTSTLVHGIIRNKKHGDVAHAWVELDDGYIYEPTTDAVYHPEDFASIHRPIPLARYEGEQARVTMVTYSHWGPWDPESEEWYEIYHSELGLGHREASQIATRGVTGE